MTFCTISVTHPSIIKVHDLLFELQKLVPFYKDELPLPVTIDNVLKYQSLIDVHCKHDENKIIYFFTIPIEYDIKFDLYYFAPLPTLVDDNYFTIIPNFKFILRKDNVIKPLLDTCSTHGIYHCSSKLATNGNFTCEANILLENSNKGCSYTKIQSHDDKLEPLPFVNQYLGWFNQNSSLKTKCLNEEKIFQPKGIFMLKMSEDCNLTIHGQDVPKLGPSKGTPVIIDFKLPQNKLLVPQTQMAIQLRTLNINKMEQHHIIPIDNLEDETITYNLSIWTILLYGLIFLVAVQTTMRKLSTIWKRRRSAINRERNIEEDSTPMTPVQLPSQASF